MWRVKDFGGTGTLTLFLNRERIKDWRVVQTIGTEISIIYWEDKS